MTMKFRLERHPANPLLIPDTSSPWESVNVFNPSVIHNNGLFHMHYRAEGEDWISRIGYAVSADGVHWNRLREPVMTPLDEMENRGVQDPRVTEIERRFLHGLYGVDVPRWGARVLPDDRAKREPHHVGTHRNRSSQTRRSTTRITCCFRAGIKGRFVAFHRPPTQTCASPSPTIS